MTRFRGFDRGARGVGVRDHVLLLPSVGCTNRTVELIARRCPSVRHLTHQHGCAQLGDDLALSRQVLAAVAANPNVRAAVVVGLGCESNQAGDLAAAVGDLGGNVEVAVLQALGGIDATVAAAEQLVARLDATPATRVHADASALTAGVIADAGDGSAARLHAAVVAALRDAGLRVIARVLRQPSHTTRAAAADRVEELWLERGTGALHADLAAAESDNPSEALALLAARGAQVCIHVTAAATPVGSPVMPVLKVGVDPSLRGLDFVDVDMSDAHDATAAVATLVDALLAVADGRETAAERWGQRDFGIPRMAPSM